MSWIAAAVSALLFLTFLFGWTGYFKLAYLSDPSQPGNQAGRIFGGVISLVACLAYVFASIRFHSQVVSQTGAYDRACEEWSTLRTKTTPTSEDFEKCLEGLRKIVTSHPRTRVAKVIASWDDASPFSDAESVLEAEASPYRNFLNFLQSIASVLVLIGLVGNFFGLAEAAQNLPQLADIGSSKAVPTTQIKGQADTLSNSSADKEVGRESSSQVTQQNTQEMSSKILKITNGLQVVVVSSVMGIGGMIFLVIFVGYYRGLFNHLVAQEVLLMSAELGSALRPLHAGGGTASAIKALSDSVSEMKDSLKSLPDRMVQFEKVAGQLGAAQTDMHKVVAQLDTVLRGQMTQATVAYTEYKEVLVGFQNYLVDRTESLNSLFENSAGVGQRLSDIVDRVQKVQTHFEELVSAQKRSQVESENYSAFLRGLVDEERESSEKRFRSLSSELTSQFRESLERSAREIESSAQASRQAASQLSSEIKSVMSSLERHLDTQRLESVNTKERLLEEFRTLQASSSQAWLEVQNGAGSKLAEVAEKVGNWSQSLQQSGTELMVQQRAQSDSMLQRMSDIAETVSKASLVAGEQLQAAVRQQQQEAMRTIVEQLRIAMSEVTELQSTSGSALKSQVENARQLQAQLQQAIERSVQVIEDANQRLQQQGDRWNTAQELHLQALFSRWRDEVASATPSMPSPVSNVIPSVSLPAELEKVLDQIRSALVELSTRQTAPQQDVAQRLDVEALNQSLQQSQQELRELLDSALSKLGGRLEMVDSVAQKLEAHFFQHLQLLLDELPQRIGSALPSAVQRPDVAAAHTVSKAPEPNGQAELKAATESAARVLEQQTALASRWTAEMEKALEAVTATLDGARELVQVAEGRAGESAPAAIVPVQTAPQLVELQATVERLRASMDRVSQVDDSSLLVCGECGAVTQLAEGYCLACQANLVSACPMSVFLLRQSAKNQQPLEQRLMAMTSAVEQLQVQLQSLERVLPSLASSPAPVVALDTLIQPLQSLQEEVAQLRSESERHLQRLVELAETTPDVPEASRGSGFFSFLGRKGKR